MLPTRPFNWHPQELNLDELIWLGEFMAKPSAAPDELREFRRVMAVSSDWTEEELGKVKLSELAEIFTKIRNGAEEERDSAVPFGNDNN